MRDYALLIIDMQRDRIAGEGGILGKVRKSGEVINAWRSRLPTA